MAVGQFLFSYGPGDPFFPPTNLGNAVALLFMILSPVALLTSLVLGVKQMSPV